MKTIKTTVVACVLSIVLTSCLGDKKAVNISEMDDTGFVNEDFKGNLISYEKGMSACENMSAADIASMYNVSEDMIIYDDISKSDRRVPNSKPACSFFIKDGENDFEWLRGSMAIDRQIGKDEPGYENANLTGGGEDWAEAWALTKSMSKSSEWIKDMGLAAVWNERHSELKIKFEGYTLSIYPIRNKLNKAEVARDRDYKKVAIEMARAAGFIK